MKLSVLQLSYHSLVLGSLSMGFWSWLQCLMCLLSAMGWGRCFTDLSQGILSNDRLAEWWPKLEQLSSVFFRRLEWLVQMIGFKKAWNWYTAIFGTFIGKNQNQSHRTNPDSRSGEILHLSVGGTAKSIAKTQIKGGGDSCEHSLNFHSS